MYTSHYQPFASLAADLLNDYASPYSKDGIASITLEAPGYKRGDITVEVADSTVTVVAENAVRGKRVWSRYLPDLDADKIEARLEDGLLHIEVACVPAALSRKVEVK